MDHQTVIYAKVLKSSQTTAIVNVAIVISLTLKAPIMTGEDDIRKYFLIVFQRKYDLMFQVNPARQRIHMKNQALFSSKEKSKKLKCRLLQCLFGPLRVKIR